jgi:hypothetical protein
VIEAFVTLGEWAWVLVLVGIPAALVARAVQLWDRGAHGRFACRPLEVLRDHKPPKHARMAVAT